MRKSILIGSLLLGASAMLVGFDSSETAESVLEKSAEAVQDASDLSIGFDLNFDADFEIGDGTITSDLSFLLGADFTIDLTRDPYALRLDGSYELSALGTGQPGSLTLYAVPDEAGGMIAYIYVADDTEEEEAPSGTWYYSKDAAADLTDLFPEDSFSSDTDNAVTNPGFTLSPEAVRYSGSECYLLSMSMDETMLSDLIGEDPDAAAAMILPLLDGIVLNIDYYVDTATYQPAGITLDLNDSDLSALNALLESLLSAYDSEDAETSAAIILNDVSLDLPFSFGPVDPITVPQEALDAVANGTAVSLDEDAEEESEEDFRYEEDGDFPEAA